MTDTTMPAKPRTRTKTPAGAAPTPAPAAPLTGPTKSATVIKMLLRAKGATPLELIAATDWQPHSLRAFLSGLRKKGRVIALEPRKSGVAAYRIVAVDTDTTACGAAANDGAAAAESVATIDGDAGANVGAPVDAGSVTGLASDGDRTDDAVTEV